MATVQIIHEMVHQVVLGHPLWGFLALFSEPSQEVMSSWRLTLSTVVLLDCVFDHL